MVSVARVKTLITSTVGSTVRSAVKQAKRVPTIAWAVIAVVVVALLAWRLWRPRGDYYTETGWRCPDGYSWWSSKEKGKACKKGNKYSGTLKGKVGDWVCPWGSSWSGSKDKGKECKNKQGKFMGTIKLGSGGGAAPAGGGGAAPAGGGAAAAPAGTQATWDCIKDGAPVGPVKLTWGFTAKDATWACNQWLPGCANRCQSQALASADYDTVVATEPGDRAIVYYKNGKKWEVTTGTKGSTPIDEGFNDTKAGGIDKVWVPAGYTLCMKNRKRIDSIHPVGPGPGYAEADQLEAKDDADDIWLTTGKCPAAKTDPWQVVMNMMP